MSGGKVQSEETDVIILKNISDNGGQLSASFLPAKGMNLISYKKGDIEVIDQSTRNIFEERFAGLGAMIGPHFHHRNPDVLPKIENESLFPHIAKVRARGTKDPFSHGIGRYASWSVEKIESSYLKAVLRGDKKWNGVALKDLEGQDFSMVYEAKLLPQGLEIHLTVNSDHASVVGLHTYYALENGDGKVMSRVKNTYNDHGTFKKIDSTWNHQQDGAVAFELKDGSFDYGFFPFSNPNEGSILLDTGERQVQVQYWCENDENSWQLWHPEGMSFVCIEPLSAKDPRNPALSASSIKILISIVDKN